MKKLKALFAIVIAIAAIFGLNNIISFTKTIKIDIEEKKLIDNSIAPDKYGHIMIDFPVFKTDENDNPLENVRFKLSGYNNAFSTYSSAVDSGVYEFNYSQSSENTFTKILNSMSDEQRTFINTIKTTQDLEKFNVGGYQNVHCNLKNSTNNKVACTAGIPTVLTIEEVKAPTGYSKTKVLVPGTILLAYSVDYDGPALEANINVLNYINNNGTYNVNLMESIILANDGIFMEYGAVDIKDLVGTDYEAIRDIWYSHTDSECIGRKVNFDTGRKAVSFETVEVAMDSPSDPDKFLVNDPCEIVIRNVKGSPKLSINTTVNEKESINTTANSKLKYRVTVNNNGTVESLDNKIISKLPEGFVYVDGSATNGGVYDKNTNTITWVIYRINENESTTVSYEAYAPNGLSNLKSYVSEATIEAYGVENRIESNKATVRLMANPKTSAPLYGIGITLVIVWIVSLYLFVYSKLVKRENRFSLH